MRSRAEISFRLRQEAANAWLLLRSPSLAAASHEIRPKLPDPALIAERLRNSAYAREVERLAGEIRSHDFPILGIRIQTGKEIRWRRDYALGIETGTEYFRRVPYLDLRRAGDHKRIWELSRHQHLVLLAQAWLLTGREDFYREVVVQLEGWMEQNPFQRGINWASALEVGFRALSWIWIYHFAGHRMEPAFRGRFLTGLYRHGLHLERNLSIYFSRNTHLLGEALALHALGALFPSFPEAGRWAKIGAGLMEREMEFQVRPDGAHFEQSTYYHVYAFDMFLLHAILGEPPEAYLRALDRMAEYLDALQGRARTIPLMGDDDGGRLFHPYGERSGFGRASLATAALFRNRPYAWAAEDLPVQAVWWLGERALDSPPSPPAGAEHSRLFPDAGLAVLSAGSVQIGVDAGPMGFQRAGHGHSDALSIVARDGETDLLIDPGTYTYVSEPEWRGRFRGSAAHNTMRPDRLDQAVPRHPFGWVQQPQVRVLEWSSTPAEDSVKAVCRYAGSAFTHTRHVRFEKPDRIWIQDEMDGPPGEHLVEQFWHAGQPVTRLAPRSFRIGARAVLSTAEGWESEVLEGGEFGWRSPALGWKIEAPVIRVAATVQLPVRLVTVLVLDPVS
jgi:hypothetical protein